MPHTQWQCKYLVVACSRHVSVDIKTNLWGCNKIQFQQTKNKNSTFSPKSTKKGTKMPDFCSIVDHEFGIKYCNEWSKMKITTAFYNLWSHMYFAPFCVANLKINPFQRIHLFCPFSHIWQYLSRKNKRKQATLREHIFNHFWNMFSSHHVVQHVWDVSACLSKSIEIWIWIRLFDIKYR